MEPFANGRFLVLSTSLSNSLSHKSLATHPAPLTQVPPTRIVTKRGILGPNEGVSQSVQQAGIKRISRPLGLFHLKRRMI